MGPSPDVPSPAGPPRPLGRRLAGAAGTLLFAVVAVLALGELHHRRLEERTNFVIPWDAPGLKYELRPGGTENSHGYNERELPVEKPAGTFRVAALGDSVTHGAFVPAEQAWPRALEDQLHAAGHAEAQVLNHAVFGYDVECIAEQLRTRILDWKPDLVVYGFYVNDPIPTEMIYAGTQPVWVGTGARPFTVLAAPLDPTLHRFSAFFRRWEGAVAARAIAAREQAQPLDWDFFARGLDRLVQIAADAGVPLLVLRIPPHVLVHPDLRTCNAYAGAGPRFCEDNLEMMARAEELFAARGLSQVDGVAAYRAGPEVDLTGNKGDAHHPAPEGHRRLATALAPVVGAMMEAK